MQVHVQHARTQNKHCTLVHVPLFPIVSVCFLLGLLTVPQSWSMDDHLEE